MPPETSFLLCDEKGDIERAKRPWEIVPAGHRIGTPEPLFKELVYCFFVVIFRAISCEKSHLVDSDSFNESCFMCRKMKMWSSSGRSLLEVKLIGL